jgi:hypothetical protein
MCVCVCVCVCVCFRGYFPGRRTDTREIENGFFIVSGKDLARRIRDELCSFAELKSHFISSLIECSFSSAFLHHQLIHIYIHISNVSNAQQAYQIKLLPRFSPRGSCQCSLFIFNLTHQL